VNGRQLPQWVLGYPDELSVRPRQTVGFHVSGAGAGSVDAQLVKLIHGDTHPDGPGFREVAIPSPVDGRYRLSEQPTQHGSYGRIPDARHVLPEAGAPVSLFAMVCASDRDGDQPLVSAWDADAGAGIVLVLEPGLRPAFWMTGSGGVQRIAAESGLVAGVWFSVGGSWDPQAGSISVRAVPVVNSYNSRVGPVAAVAGCGAEAPAVAWAAVPPVDLLLGAFDSVGPGLVHGAFNGKLALPAVYERALDEAAIHALSRSGAAPALEDGLRAWWDLSREIESSAVRGGTPESPDGTLVNAPTRAVTAHNWDGSAYEWRTAPERYGAVHFHDDDVDDVGWEPMCALEVPSELGSGVYALPLRAGEFEDHVPFFVRALPGREADVALVLPTASYMAYGNEHMAAGAPMGQAIIGHTPALHALDLLLMEHPELGLSAYDLHSDGSGVALCSRRRPIVNMRPRHRFSFMGTWQFPSDLYIVDWLEHFGYRYDVLTDEDLHRDGAQALQPYRAVLTGTHPEYASERMLDAYETYATGGGNLMYMGGNGFYWVISYSEEKPWVMEIRRGEAGVRAWQAAPGETTHSTTGEKGGLWRNRGRAPQKLFGTGFASEGYSASYHYSRMPDADDPAVSWVFDGVPGEQRIGDFGLVGGGASGQEIDRADVALGTPPGTYLLASAYHQDDSYKVVPEEVEFMFDGLGGTEHPNVRADMTYFETPGGGAVFAASSIAWSGALSSDGYENNVSRITANVLDRFIGARA
jgi:N,N-dimethylformamidase